MKNVSCFVLSAGLLLAAALTPPAFGQDTQRQYLSGHGKDDAVPWKFFCTAGNQSGYWTNLVVPFNWELKGFGELSYQYDPTNVPVEQGRYEHTFTVPADWAGRRVFLVFDGSMTDTRATVNGESAGPVHQGSFYRFKYEVTRFVKFGATNRLEVTVDKRSANASVNRAERQGDYWLFGGIFRPVYLEAVPVQFIERVAIDARADGAFAMDVFANGVTGADAGMSFEAQITDLDGKPIGPPFTQDLAGDKAALKTQIASPRQWTAETPNLYRVEVRLKHGSEVLHRFQQRFGFRTMEVRDGDGLYVNGRRVILKGCDRHSAWPDSGRCLSEAVHRLDINVMKDMNMNAVRMSHYPPDEQFLDLCDELGLYVLDELGGWHHSYDSEVGHKLVAEMVTRDVNHPCILFWDNGNEGGWNRELDGDFAQWDPQQRRVLHPWEIFSGVNASHYLAYDRAKIACEGQATPRGQNNPSFGNLTNAAKYIYMPTEFLHGLYDGGAGAGLEDYWEMMQHSKYIGGGFIWAFLDEGAKQPDDGRMDVAGNRAPDGIVGPYREKEASFYTIKEIWSPIVVTSHSFLEVEAFLYDNASISINLENRYSFTDLSSCRFTWQLCNFAEMSGTNAGLMVITNGTIPGPAIAPGKNGELIIKLPRLSRPGMGVRADAFTLCARDPTGRELWTWVWGPNDRLSVIRPLFNPRKGLPSTSETKDAIQLKSEDLIANVSKQTGLLTDVKRGGQHFSLANGPRLVAGDAMLKGIEVATNGTAVTITATFTGNLEKVVWFTVGNGWLGCEYTYHESGTNETHGVVFDYPEKLVKHKRWLGDGPYRVWQNRRRGVTLGVWENDYNNTITGWSDWVYPEFKGCFANVYWMQLETSEGLITVEPGNAPFVQVLTPEFPPKELQARTAVSLPQAGLAFLQTIPAMGSKFHGPKESGPQGQPAQAAGEYTNTVNFYFGRLP